MNLKKSDITLIHLIELLRFLLAILAEKKEPQYHLLGFAKNHDEAFECVKELQNLSDGKIPNNIIPFRND